MSTFNYPPLRIGLLQNLVTLKELFDENPDFLKESPYDNEAKDILARLLAPKIIEKTVEVEVFREAKVGRGRPSKDTAVTAEDQDLVTENIKDLLEELKNLGSGDKNLETSEKIKIINTKANLDERLIKMQERMFNVKRMSDFQSTIISILDDLVSEKDRNVFLKRIEPFRD